MIEHSLKSLISFKEDSVEVVWGISEQLGWHIDEMTGKLFVGKGTSQVEGALFANMRINQCPNFTTINNQQVTLYEQANLPLHH